MINISSSIWNSVDGYTQNNSTDPNFKLMRYYIPENLEVETILQRKPPIEIKTFSKDKFLYVVHLLSAIPANNKKLEIKNGFVPVYSQVLKDVIPNYREYFDYLIEQNIIETDNQYIAGKKSKGYRFTELYQTDTCIIESNDKLSQRLTQNNKRAMHLVDRSYPYLTKWFDKHLQIDYELAMDFIHTDREQRYENLQHLPNEKEVEDKIFSIQTRFNSSYINIKRINSKDFTYSVSPLVNRFYSNLSYLRSILRNALTYNGDPLISIDIKNCQPYLSVLLTEESFWQANPDNHFTIDKFKRTEFFKTIPISEIIHLISNHKVQSDMQIYVEFATSGKFYEQIEKLARQTMTQTFSNRKEIKKAMLRAMFSSNKYFAVAAASFKRMFKEQFPVTYELFALLKQNEKETFPILLQRMESKLIIETVCKRIGKEKPSLPIFTIHDSIATTKGNECYVKSVIEEELYKAIGYPPKLNMHEWKPENLWLAEAEPDLEETLEALCM